MSKANTATNIFLNLEKRNYSKKLVSKFNLQNGSVLTNQFDILEEQSKFYQSLSNSQKSNSADEPDDVFFNPRNISTLSDNDQALCEGLIAENEAFKALKEFAVAKSPGTDGLTTEFFKYFWPELKTLIVGSFNYAFPNGSVLVDIPTTRHNFSYSQKKQR